ncbi:4-hydroxy-3-methylbut-2-enyl diphosphate reductase [Dehalococcoidia bacterium]|nr:4-hydroxy-3-methylbut-2-enyl diphosphate reductase [Dehalococcoidia bacterium]
MEIRLTSERGFCSGVRRAIELAERAVESGKPLASLGAIVHNRQVIEHLSARGMRIVESLDEADGATLLIPSHGVGRQVMSELDARKLSLLDATCPIVLNAQQVAHRLHREGFMVLIFGDASHTEVKGLLSWAGESAMATTTTPDLSTSVRRIGVLSQTTQSQTQFAAFLAQLVDSQLASLSEIYVFNTICDATTRRQAAALQLASEVDLMLVIGGYDSANTRHLAEICSSTGARTLHIESADEIGPSWHCFGASRIGVTGGASTPEWVIKEVIEKLEGIKP